MDIRQCQSPKKVRHEREGKLVYACTHEGLSQSQSLGESHPVPAQTLPAYKCTCTCADVNYTCTHSIIAPTLTRYM